VNVLVVDDSAVVRQALTMILSQGRSVTVAVAADPLIAVEKIKRVRPDVIVLDVEMPRMDGLTFLRQIMSSPEPIPVVVCSSLAQRGTEVALQALEEGAVAVVEKPRIGVREFLHDQATVLYETVHAAAGARVRPRRPGLPVPVAPAPVLKSPPSLTVTTDTVVAIGASTGGTEALREVLEGMPPDAPGIVIVQHMPEVFTRAFADRLNKTCRIEVKEAETGDRVHAGRALIAPGNRHLLVRRSGARYLADIIDGPPVSRHRPSVDVLFRSVAEAAGPNAIGVILTGMGRDGAAGLLDMHRVGATTIAQDQASCVVFGMPKEAIAAGGVDEVVPLTRITELLLKSAAARLSVRRR
jgi:two-component system, chemotaxis family, protein-glutamate methylesterase/glutaminase